jgi:hypothetical protein
VTQLPRESGDVRHLNEHGELIDCPDCTNLERALRTERRLRAKAEKERALALGDEPEADDIREVAAYWQRHYGRRTVKPGGSDGRWDAVRRILREGYTVERIKLAIDGAMACPYSRYGVRVAVPAGSHDKRRDDLKFICASGDRVEDLEKYGLQAKLGSLYPDCYVEAYLHIRDLLLEAGLVDRSRGPFMAVQELLAVWRRVEGEPSNVVPIRREAA